MNCKYKISKSSIQGKGVICTNTIHKHELIDQAIYFKYKLYPIITEYIGKWVNHSYKPNCHLIKLNDGNYYFKALKTIKKNQEMTLNYNHTPWFIMGPMPWYT